MDKSAILVVDDEETYCDVIADILESYGFGIHIAYSAFEAFALLESITPDLVLLDVMMPEVDGLTVLRQMRSHPKWTDIPVVVASAKVLSEDRSAALEAGADLFLPKPFTVKEFRAALRPFVAVPDTGSLEYSI
jgi:CheY-like chemotaxis protein